MIFQSVLRSGAGQFEGLIVVGEQLIQKKTYPYTTSTGTFEMTPSFGGGAVSCVGPDVYQNDGRWGVHNLFDNIRSLYDWVGYAPNPDGAMLKFTFPRNVRFTDVLIAPRADLAGPSPGDVLVYVDGVLITDKKEDYKLSSENGLIVDYSGSGYMIQFDKTGSVLDIVIKGISSWAYIGELELFGFPA